MLDGGRAKLLFFVNIMFKQIDIIDFSEAGTNGQALKERSSS